MRIKRPKEMKLPRQEKIKAARPVKEPKMPRSSGSRNKVPKDPEEEMLRKRLKNESI